MLSPFEPLATIGKTNLDAAVQFATSAAECTERLIKLQVEAARGMVQANDENLQLLLSKPVTFASLSSWQSANQDTVQKALEIARCYLAEVSKAQAEAAQLIGEQVAVMSKNAVKNLQDFAKSAIEESEKQSKPWSNPPRRNGLPDRRRKAEGGVFGSSSRGDAPSY